MSRNGLPAIVRRHIVGPDSGEPERQPVRLAVSGLNQAAQADGRQGGVAIDTDHVDVDERRRRQPTQMSQPHANGQCDGAD